jgi:hypothetical protein
MILLLLTEKSGLRNVQSSGALDLAYIVQRHRGFLVLLPQIVVPVAIGIVVDGFDCVPNAKPFENLNDREHIYRRIHPS